MHGFRTVMSVYDKLKFAAMCLPPLEQNLKLELSLEHKTLGVLHGISCTSRQ